MQLNGKQTIVSFVSLSAVSLLFHDWVCFNICMHMSNHKYICLKIKIYLSSVINLIFFLWESPVVSIFLKKLKIHFFHKCFKYSILLVFYCQVRFISRYFWSNYERHYCNFLFTMFINLNNFLGSGSALSYTYK